ncbi:hypothetical protein HanXRQr2_Chr12g0525731 [Helianthus annuus]|uniref:Uncharacterized protein n=1 Tax=Helianthus annuus TaxID=4232 RepID=A0A9K3END9_HELAN|nr:hypothetical protein HanXRQr2_Chr12g0525731 [Helianthus annuus]
MVSMVVVRVTTAAVEPAGATSENCGRWTEDGGGGGRRWQLNKEGESDQGTGQ